MTIHIFNPETDYALANEQGNYTPPASVVKIRKKMALFPAVYAQSEDFILAIDGLGGDELREMDYYEEAMKKNIRVISLNDLPCVVSNKPIGTHAVIQPWGWNMSLRNLLLRHGVPSFLLKSEVQIENIRRLSHRRITMPFQNEIARQLPGLSIKMAKEFKEEKQALAFASANPGAYFKMPWSSSGRGVICSSQMDKNKLTEWIHGAIAKQGSILGEYGYDRVADFATEWQCRNGDVEFAGLSWFNTTSNGNYLGNARLGQDEIRNRICEVSALWGQEIVMAQENAVRKLIAPHYDGPLGIDMLADREGNINPCVEINIRMTMGMAAILSNQ